MCDLRWVIQRTPLNSHVCSLLSLLGDAFGIYNPRAGSLNSLIQLEALRKNVARLWPSKKTKGKAQWWDRIDEFWFLGSSHWDLCICSESCVLDSQNHFNKSPFSWKSIGSGLLSILIQTWFYILQSQTQTEAAICFNTIKSDTLYSLLRIGCTDHQTQFTSILGSSAQSVSECVLGAAL